MASIASPRRSLSTLGAGLLGVLLSGALAVGSLTPADAAPVGTMSVVRADEAPVLADPGTYVPPAIDWGRCRDEFESIFGLQCGWLVVPLDYADPTGPTTELRVSRLKHTAPPSKYRGVMLTNPGGPGAGGTWMPLLGTTVPRGAGELWDWIGLDPRGTAQDAPRLLCDRSYGQGPRPAYIPHGDGTVATWSARAKGYAADCAKAPGRAILDHAKTTDTVQDLESLRIALGAEQVGFYGYSYGSYLGQVYATLHPDRVKAMVLDSNVDSSQVWYAGNLAQSEAFDRTARAFFRYLGRANFLFHLGRGGKAVEKTYHRMLRQLRRHPVGEFGSSELTDALSISAYSSDLWPLLGIGLKRLERRGRPGFLAHLTGGTSRAADNAYAMYLATTCTDAPFPSSLKTWIDDTADVYAEAPFAAWSNTWGNLPCRTWPAAAGTPVTVDGSALSVPVLLADETGDAPTPFAGSVATRRRFPTASLMAGTGGWSHGATLKGNACMDLRVTRYLRYGEVPPRQSSGRYDLACPVRPAGDIFTFGLSFRWSSTSAGGARTTDEIHLNRAQKIELIRLRAGLPPRG